MKIALICPSNMLYMPYVKNYEQLLIESEINYEIINWDRFGTEEKGENIFKDKKIGHQRNYFDYLKYKMFLLKRLNTTKYDKVIVFGIQLAYILKNVLLKNFKGKYVVDIRDYNKIIKYFKNLKDVIEYSEFVVLSSPRFKEFLPDSHKYKINHNTQLTNLKELKQVSDTFADEKVSIAYIGAPRDLHINLDLINSLKNNGKVDLYFHGEGESNNDILKFLKENAINNVFITGRYKKEDEANIYEKNNLINVLRYNDGINNKTALPNRLYNSVFYAKPMLAFEGSYLAEEVTAYKIGVVISSFDDIEQKIFDYLGHFDTAIYNKGRELFLSKVVEENQTFKDSFIKFISHEFG